MTPPQKLKLMLIAMGILYFLQFLISLKTGQTSSSSIITPVQIGGATYTTGL